MKTLICILLLAYWLFGAAPDRNNDQAVALKEQTAFKRQNNFVQMGSTASQVMYLDANGNIVKPESEIK